jgi:hypothetical protein
MDDSRILSNTGLILRPNPEKWELFGRHDHEYDRGDVSDERRIDCPPVEAPDSTCDVTQDVARGRERYVRKGEGGGRGRTTFKFSKFTCYFRAKIF